MVNMITKKEVPTREQIKSWVLNKMKRHRHIGGKHTEINNIRKGSPQEFHSEIEKVIGELIKERTIVVKLTSYGKHVSLNPRLMQEINEFIQKYYTEVIFN